MSRSSMSPGPDRPPPEQFARRHAGRRLVDREDPAQEAEVLGRGGSRRQVQVAADHCGDVADRDALVGDRVQHRSCRGLLQRQTAGLAAARADALRGRGIPEPAASLAAETGIVVFKVAFAHWISEPGRPDLPGILRASMEELRNVLAERTPV
ncbi:hypothetical protein ACFU5O_15635 [Streptomyces sp. NPDC057445]|uniref:hypothetical protein n=1 Tax=Streptomyces sp. NPDC057445 TaxID=3346136 RepID=UPI0036A6986F